MRDSKADFQFLDFATRKPNPRPPTLEISSSGSVHSKRRATDQRAVLPMVGVRNGLIAGACIWPPILTILAGMAS
jgi:uncharacterized protein YcsI (UPF0317 family)